MEKPAIEGGSPVRQDKLAFIRPYTGREEEEALKSVLSSGWLATGPEVSLFEEKIKNLLGVKHAIAMNSCTSALHSSLYSLGIGAGDEVITVSNTFASTAHEIVHLGATPVFIDILSDTYDMDPSKIEEKITPRTKAIMPVHYGGKACRIKEILNIAKKHGLFVVEDAAGCLGAELDGVKLGNFGDITCFSFHATKLFITGEGGVAVTNNDELAEKLRTSRYFGIRNLDSYERSKKMDKGSWYFEIEYPGFKYNLSNLLAAIGIVQLGRAQWVIERRNQIADFYKESLSGLNEIILPRIPKDRTCVWQIYPILLNLDRIKIGRDAFISALIKENISTGVFYLPLHLQPYYMKKFNYRKGDLPATEYAYERTLSLPLYHAMSDNDSRDVAAAVKKLIVYYRK